MQSAGFVTLLNSLKSTFDGGWRQEHTVKAERLNLSTGDRVLSDQVEAERGPIVQANARLVRFHDEHKRRAATH